MSVVAIEPTGAGALALAFEQLKQRLGAEGLFDPARKRPLPFLPRRIGVVTSAQGAVIRDIVRVAHRRFPVPILLSPTPVQGDGAALGIAAAIRRLEAVADVDVIIVARGGGSLEDLWAFNEEPVARAIVACRVPVISAVGHETDFTIADFVADLRAPTPSAAAELAVPVRDDLADGAGRCCGAAAARALAEAARRARHELERARARLGDPRRLLDERRQRLDEQVERGRRVLARRLAAARADLRERRDAPATAPTRTAASPSSAARWRRCATGWRRRCSPALVRRRHAIEAARGKLEALSPMRVLERGFSLTQRADGHVVTSAADVQPGERITVRVHDGGVDATVEGRMRVGSRRAARREPSRRVEPSKGPTKMIRAAVLGADVSKSRSPAIHNAAFRALRRRRANTSRSRVDARRLPARWSPTCAREGYRYLNVTIPHKAAAARLAERHGPEVRVSGAANTLLFERAAASRAENTDGAGPARRARRSRRRRRAAASS